jgi:hypothetical protein
VLRLAAVLTCCLFVLAATAAGAGAGSTVHRPSATLAKKAANLRIDALARRIEEDRDTRSPCTARPCDAAGEIESCRLATRTSKVWTCRGVVGHYVNWTEYEEETSYRYLIFVRYASSRTTTLSVAHKLLAVTRS